MQYKRMKKELNYRDYVLIQFLFASACRIGEAQNLLWEDVRNAPISHVIFRDTKNGEDHLLRITKRVLDLLQSLPHISERVFTSYRGDPISIPECNLMLKRRAEKIGLKKHVHSHIFRHSMGYYLGSIGFDEALIAKFLNHKDINTTKRYTQRDLEQLTPLAYANPLENPSKSIGELSDGARKLLEKFFGRGFNIIQENLSGGAVFKVVLINKT
jgi:integrase